MGFRKGAQRAIEFSEQERDSGFDDHGILESVREAEDVRQLPDFTKDFSDSLTPAQIFEAIQEDEDLLLIVHDPHYKLPENYYPPLDKESIWILILLIMIMQ